MIIYSGEAALIVAREKDFKEIERLNAVVSELRESADMIGHHALDVLSELKLFEPSLIRLRSMCDRLAARKEE